MNSKNYKIIFRVDEEARRAFRELTSKHFLNVSAFLRKCLMDKYKEMEEAEQKQC